VAQIIVGAWLGNKIKGEPPAINSAVIGRMALGLLIIRLVGLIPILGAFVRLAVLLWGTGAVLLGFYRIARVEATASAPQPA
jgi:hypothetical protein